METDILVQLIDARHDVLVQLCQLARRQSELIHEGDMSRLFGLLAVKQRLLADLQQLEQRLDPFRAQDPERREWRSVADRRKCRETADRCEAMLAEILAAERLGESELSRRRDQTAALLQGMHGVARATQAYGEVQSLSGSQFDMSCDT